MLNVIDMHCHLDFLDHPAGFAREAGRRGLSFFCNTVTPQGFEAASKVLATCDNVRVGAGLHPWWIHDGRCTHNDAERLCGILPQTRFVGEVGLDFGKCADSRDAQVRAFRCIAQACAREGGKLLSIHAVRSASVVLDILEETGCLASNQVAFHWYSDANDALWRAVRAGCFFSINPRMLRTKRGREYARTIPANRLLLETDLPPEHDGAFPLATWEATLRDTLAQLQDLREEPLEQRIFQTSTALLRLT